MNIETKKKMAAEMHREVDGLTLVLRAGARMCEDYLGNLQSANETMPTNEGYNHPS